MRDQEGVYRRIRGHVGRAQQAGCSCGQKAEHHPGENEDAQVVPRLASQYEANEVDQNQAHQPRDGEMHQRRVQPADEIEKPRRLALNLARAHSLDIADLFHCWRPVCR